MPDISMCEGGDCPQKEDCYRFKATPTPMSQAYFMTPPFNGGGCSEFKEIWKAQPNDQ